MSTRKRWAPLALVAGLALLLPTMPAAGERIVENGYTIEEVGAPITAVNIRTAAMGALPDGSPVVYAPTYGEPALLSVVQGETGELISVHELGDKTTSNYTGISPDGSAYAAGQTPGANLFRYDPATDSVTDLGAPVSGETNISRLTSFADDGTLYSGTFPHGHVFSYHPERGFHDYGPIVEGEQYARSTAFDGDQTLYVGTGTNARLFSMDVTTGEKTEILLPTEYAGNQTYLNEMYYRDGLLFAFVSPGYAYLIYDTVAGEWRESITDVQATPITDVADGKVYFIKRNPNDMYSYDLATGAIEQVTAFGQFAINANRGFGLLALEDPAWPGLTAAGMGLTGRMWHYNLQTTEFRWVQSEASAGALKIAAMGVAPDNHLYTAGYLTPSTMARVDVATLEHETLPGPTQAEFIEAIPGSDGTSQLYIGTYLDAGIWRFDHTRDWNYPSNPARVTRLDGYEQERVMTIVNAGDRLAIGTLGKKGEFGGALSIVDPVTGAVDWSGEPVENYSVASLLHREVDGRGLLIGGTASYNLGIEPPDPAARLFLFDMATRTTEFVTIPRPDVTSIAKILELPDGRVWAFANNSTILELDIVRDDSGDYSLDVEEVVSVFGEPRRAGNWAGSRMHMLDESTVVGNAGGTIYTVDIDTLEARPITQGSQATPSGDGRIFFVRDTKVFVATPEGWTPPEPTDPDPDPAPEPVNVALAENGGTATGSSAHTAYTPSNVIDGDTSSVGSRWITAVGDASPWLEIAFAQESPIDTVSLYQYGGYELSSYNVSAMVDGEWVTVAEVSGNLSSYPVHRFDGVHASAIRLDAITSRDGRARLYEVEVTCQDAEFCDPQEPEPEVAPSTTLRYWGNNWIAVTLTPEDEGSGIGQSEYRLDDGEWVTYEGEFSIKRADRQLLQYRSTSPDGTVEDTRCVSFLPGDGRVDVTVTPADAVCEVS